jgi:hypothetical protein
MFMLNYLFMMSPMTGDESKPWLWISLAVGVAGLSVVLLLMSKRDKSDDDE